MTLYWWNLESTAALNASSKNSGGSQSGNPCPKLDASVLEASSPKTAQTLCCVFATLMSKSQGTVPSVASSQFEADFRLRELWSLGIRIWYDCWLSMRRQAKRHRPELFPILISATFSYKCVHNGAAQFPSLVALLCISDIMSWDSHQQRHSRIWNLCTLSTCTEHVHLLVGTVNCDDVTSLGIVYTVTKVHCITVYSVKTVKLWRCKNSKIPLGFGRKKWNARPYTIASLLEGTSYEKGINSSKKVRNLTSRICESLRYPYFSTPVINCNSNQLQQESEVMLW